jgi:hypothetical protein
MGMRVLSIDVGRKNLALCAYDAEDDKIMSWTVRSMPAIDVMTVKDTLDALCRDDNTTLSVDMVLIERQPASNPSMRRLEGVIAMYFAMRNIPVTIVSSTEKLKHAQTTPYWPMDGKTSSYYARKKTAVLTVTKYLKDTDQDDAVHSVFAETVKKDDLSDAFLQALAWTSKKKIYAVGKPSQERNA